MEMKFDVISHVVAKIKSENFLIENRGIDEVGCPLILIDTERGDLEFRVDELDELIQGLILFKDNNKKAIKS